MVTEKNNNKNNKIKKKNNCYIIPAKSDKSLFLLSRLKQTYFLSFAVVWYLTASLVVRVHVVEDQVKISTAWKLFRTFINPIHWPIIL